MQYEYILMVIPIIIIVAFLVVIAKRMTDGERLDISGAVLGTIIIAVGLLIMVPIISSVDPQYAYDDEDKTFTLYKNVTGTEFSWGSAANAESLIIEDTVTTISAGAFASFTDLKYISIPESLETIGEGAFPTLKDYLDQTITEPEAGEYYGFGDGELYLADYSILNISSGLVRGLASGYASAVNIVIPETYENVPVTGTSSTAFMGTSLENVVIVGDSMTTFAYRSFREAASLERITVPDSLTSIAGECFYNCTSLESVSLPRISSLGNSIFYGCTALKSATFEKMPEDILTNLFAGCTALESFDMPEGVLTVGASNFYNCTSLESVSLPDSLTTLGASVFTGCTDIASVKIGAGLTSVSSNTFSSWTFYDSDGTTELDKTVAANLAGFTFQGTASALVKVLPDRSVLTTEQTLQVQELTKKAALTLKLEESELQISEKAELAEA